MRILSKKYMRRQHSSPCPHQVYSIAWQVSGVPRNWYTRPPVAVGFVGLSTASATLVGSMIDTHLPSAASLAGYSVLQSVSVHSRGCSVTLAGLRQMSFAPIISAPASGADLVVTRPSWLVNVTSTLQPSTFSTCSSAGNRSLEGAVQETENCFCV